jgi:hypothetical protein
MGGSGRPFPHHNRGNKIRRKDSKMETQFIYLNEDAKFWILSSIVGLAILILIFLSSINTRDHAGLRVENTGEIKYYSKILGVNPADDYWSGDTFKANILEWDNWQRGDIAYAANIK